MCREGRHKKFHLLDKRKSSLSNHGHNNRRVSSALCPQGYWGRERDFSSVCCCCHEAQQKEEQRRPHIGGRKQVKPLHRLTMIYIREKRHIPLAYLFLYFLLFKVDGAKLDCAVRTMDRSAPDGLFLSLSLFLSALSAERACQVVRRRRNFDVTWRRKVVAVNLLLWGAVAGYYRLGSR